MREHPLVSAVGRACFDPQFAAVSRIYIFAGSDIAKIQAIRIFHPLPTRFGRLLVRLLDDGIGKRITVKSDLLSDIEAVFQRFKANIAGSIAHILHQKVLKIAEGSISTGD